MTRLCTIVGAGPGLGAALARRFGGAGFSVALIGRRKIALQQTICELGSDLRVAGFTADAAEASSLQNAFDDLHRWGGDTEVLIYNAAVMNRVMASSLSAALAQSDMAVNLGGALTAVSAVVGAMRKRGDGTLLFTSGGLSLEPYPEWASLAAGKAALRAYSIALHKELAPIGVRVVAITICGIIERGGRFDPDEISALYWKMAQPGPVPREAVFLPDGADSYYNDPEARYRATSRPIEPSEGERFSNS